MANTRDQDEASYLQEGLSVRSRRRNRPKPPRGMMPINEVDGEEWARTVQPLVEALSAVSEKLETMRADPKQAQLDALAVGRPLTNELCAFADELKETNAQRIRIQIALARIFDNAPEVGHVPQTEQATTHPWTKLAMTLLAACYTDATPKHVVGTMDEARQRETLRHFRKMFGVRVSEAWALAVVAEVRKAALDRQNAGIRQASLKEDELERFTAPPDDATAHAELVLKQIRDAMSTWPVRFDLPTWLDAPLLAYFIGRHGFDRGGGAGRKISRATLLKLLTNPKALLRDIEKSSVAATLFAANLAALQRREPITAHVNTVH